MNNDIKQKFALAGMILASFAAGGTYAAYAQEPVPPPPECHEDEPCWDCETMGNGVCGPLPDGVTVEQIQQEELETGMTSTEIITEIIAQHEGVDQDGERWAISASVPAEPVDAMPRYTG